MRRAEHVPRCPPARLSLQGAYAEGWRITSSAGAHYKYCSPQGHAFTKRKEAIAARGASLEVEQADGDDEEMEVQEEEEEEVLEAGVDLEEEEEEEVEEGW